MGQKTFPVLDYESDVKACIILEMTNFFPVRVQRKLFLLLMGAKNSYHNSNNSKVDTCINCKITPLVVRTVTI